MSSDSTDTPETPEEVSLSLRDYWKYAPDKEQWRSNNWVQKEPLYPLIKMYSFIGITSVRWDRLVKLNKFREMGYEGHEAAKETSERYE